jgi:hypothetical protein
MGEREVFRSVGSRCSQRITGIRSSILLVVAASILQLGAVFASPNPSALFQVQLCAHHGIDFWLFRDGVLLQTRQSGAFSVFQPSYTDPNQQSSDANDLLLPMTPVDVCGVLPTDTDLEAQSATYTMVARRRSDAATAPLGIRLSSSESTESSTNWVCSGLADNSPFDAALQLGSMGPDWTAAGFDDSSWTRAAVVKTSSLSARFQRTVVDADVCAFALPTSAKPIWLRDATTQLSKY